MFRTFSNKTMPYSKNTRHRSKNPPRIKYDLWFNRGLFGASAASAALLFADRKDEFKSQELHVEEGDNKERENNPEVSHVIAEQTGDWDIREKHYPVIRFVKNDASTSNITEIEMELAPSPNNFSLDESLDSEHAVFFKIKFSAISEEQMSEIKSFFKGNTFIEFDSNKVLTIDVFFNGFDYDIKSSFLGLISKIADIGQIDAVTANQIYQMATNPKSSQFDQVIAKEQLRLLDLKLTKLEKYFSETEEEKQGPRLG